MEHKLHEAIVTLSRDGQLPHESYQTMAAVLLPLEDRLVGGERVLTVEALLLHVWLGSPQDFSKWIEARIAQFGYVHGTDFALQDCMGPDDQVHGGKPRGVVHYLTLDMAKELALVERNQKGRDARLYFIACEKRLNMTHAAPAALQALSDPHQLRTLLLDFAERLIATECEPATDIQKQALDEAHSEATNAQSVQSVAKVMGIGSVKFFEWLRRAGILMHNNLPYQCHIDAGYFKVVQRSFIGKNDEKQLYARTFVTEKGLTYLQKRYQTPLTPAHA